VWPFALSLSPVRVGAERTRSKGVAAAPQAQGAGAAGACARAGNERERAPAVEGLPASVLEIRAAALAEA